MSEMLHVDAERGLWIPPHLREYTGQIVLRTPRGTIQHFGGTLDAYYGLIDESSFGEVEEFRDPKNPDLAPDRVSIKRQGEEATVFEVVLLDDDDDDEEGEKPLITDGGREHDDLVEEFGEDAVVDLDGPFISGAESFIHENQYDDPIPDPEDCCVECGEEAYNFRCPSCGRPLCTKHSELGGGYCPDFGRDEEGRPGCEIDGEFCVAEHLIEDEADLVSDGGVASDDETEHVPHSSADYDDMDYVDDRGIRVFDREWACPNCGDEGELMFRPGSKHTCTRCFWVIGGQNNDYVLNDWPLKYRDAQRLLAEIGDDWHGTPGSVATRLRKHFDSPEQAGTAFRERVLRRAATDGGREYFSVICRNDGGQMGERPDGGYRCPECGHIAGVRVESGGESA